MADKLPSTEAAQRRSTNLVNIPVIVYAKFGVSREFPEEQTTAETVVEPYRFIYSVKCTFNDELNITRTYQGLNCVDKFYHTLDTDLAKILKQIDEDLTDVPLFLHNFSKDGPGMIEMMTKNKNGKTVHLNLVDPIGWNKSTKTIMDNLEHQVEDRRNWDKLRDKAQTGSCAKITNNTPSPLTSENLIQLTEFEKMPIVVYAKFNTTIAEKFSTSQKLIDIPYSFSYVIKCSSDDELSELRTYDGLDCAGKFYDNLKKDIANILNQIDDDVSVIPVILRNYYNYDDCFLSRVLGARKDGMSIGSNDTYQVPLKIKTKCGKEVRLRFVELLNKSTKTVAEDATHIGEAKNILKTHKGLVRDRKNKLPLVVYANFQSFMEPNMDDSSTTDICKDIPYSFVYYIKCSENDELSKITTYHGKKCAGSFIKTIGTDVASILKQINDDVSVIPVFIHDLSKYNAYFYCRLMIAGKLSGVAAFTHENDFVNFSSLTYKELTTKNKNGDAIQLRFIDTTKFFMKGQPLNVVENLENMNREKFTISLKHWNSAEKLGLMLKKGLFPCIKSEEDLQQTFLPPKDHFYSYATNINISEGEYQRAIKIWDLFECETIRDYLELYAKSHVLILADLVENLRRKCMETFSLDPAKYFDTTSFLFEAILQLSGIFVMFTYYYFCNKKK